MEGWDKQVEVSVKVDKIQIAVYFEHVMDEYDQFRFYRYSVYDGDFEKKGVVHTAHPSSSFTSMSQPLVNGGCLFIRYGYSHKMFKAFLEFNPNNVDMFELRGHLNLLLDHGFDSLWNRGTVTKCEFAVDVKNVKFHDFLYLDTKLRNGSSQWRIAGSDYIGSQRSSRSFIAYDKQKQLKDTKKKDLLGYDLLRIEARIRGAKRFRLKEIPAVESPFGSFLVIDRDAFMTSALPVIAQLRNQLPCHEGCLQLAFAGLTSGQRKQAVVALSTMRPDWWQIGVIWAAFPSSEFVAAGSKTWLH